MRKYLQINLFIWALLYGYSYSFAQNVGVGTSTPQTKLDVSGDIAWKTWNLTLINGNNGVLSPSAAYSYYRITGPTAAFSIEGLAGGEDGRLVTLYNATNQTFTVENLNVGAGTDGISVGTANISIPQWGSITLQYNTTDNRWVMVNTAGDTGMGGNDWKLDGNSNVALKSIGTNNAYDLPFETANAEKMRLTVDGKVLVGTPVSGPYPWAKLEIADNAGFMSDFVMRTGGGSGAYTGFIMQTSEGNLTTPTVKSPGARVGMWEIQAHDGADFQPIAAIHSYTGTGFASGNILGRLAFNTRNTSDVAPRERMTIAADGRVGIATANPSHKLDIVGGGARTGTHATAGLGLYVTNTSTHNSNGVEFRHDNGTQGIGFGYNTIYATGSNASQDLGFQALGTGGALLYTTNALERMRVEANGNVGISATAPAVRLAVSGNGTNVYATDVWVENNIHVQGNETLTVGGRGRMRIGTAWGYEGLYVETNSTGVLNDLVLGASSGIVKAGPGGVTGQVLAASHGGFAGNIIYTQNSFEAGGTEVVTNRADQFTQQVAAFIGTSGSRFQSFTAAQSGNWVQLKLGWYSGSGTITLNVFSGEGLGGTLLTTMPIVKAAGLQTYTFPAPIAVVAGNKYTFEVSDVTGSFWVGTGYPGGYYSGNYTNDIWFEEILASMTLPAFMVSPPQYGGRVGVGTNLPLSKLHVGGGTTGNIQVDRGASIGVILPGHTNNGTTNTNFGAMMAGGLSSGMRVISEWDGTGNDEYLAFHTHNGGVSIGERMRIDMNGNVGIGTTAPDQLLSVNGNASKVGGGSWATFSDKRLKQNIQPFQDGLQTLMEIRPVTFEYNGLGGYPANGKTYVGVIAQDMQKVAPYMVETVSKKMHPEDKENTELLMYDPSALDYITINAIQTQQKQIETQQAEIEMLKAQIAALVNGTSMPLETKATMPTDAPSVTPTNVPAAAPPKSASPYNQLPVLDEPIPVKL